MKLTNLAKSIVAASALTVASFGANASAISTIDLDITNLAFLFQDSNGNAIDNTSITTTNVDFTTSQSSATVNGSANPGVRVDDVSGDFTITASNGSGSDTNGTGSYGLVDFSGALDAAGGADGSTSASASAYGNNSASSSADVLNSFDSTFNLSVHCDPDAISCDTTNVMGASVFGWNLDVLLDVFDWGQSANASWEFGYSIKEQGALGGGHNYVLNSSTIDNSVALNQNGNAAGSDSGDLMNSPAPGDFDIKDTFAIKWDTVYTISITQKVSAGVTSVNLPEPTSVAILGLGLLGLAGASRRKKS